MAYVVARPGGRFEVRESLHTPKGPRARTLAGFDVLTDEILAKAAGKAERPFDVHTVLASSRRAGAPVSTTIGAEWQASAGAAAKGKAANARRETGAAPETSDSASQFVESSRRMALALRRTPATRRTNPGATLIDLLGFADAVTRGQPARPLEPLTFPVLRQLVEHRRGAAVMHSG
jgi:hypothetical protein